MVVTWGCLSGFCVADLFAVAQYAHERVTLRIKQVLQRNNQALNVCRFPPNIFSDLADVVIIQSSIDLVHDVKWRWSITGESEILRLQQVRQYDSAVSTKRHRRVAKHSTNLWMLNIKARAAMVCSPPEVSPMSRHRLPGGKTSNLTPPRYGSCKQSAMEQNLQYCVNLTRAP